MGLNESYRKFRAGEPISDLELSELLRAINSALPILDAHSDFALAGNHLYHERERLEAFRRARQG
mgnify:CR=1 FL=1